jgi:glycine hydroxymethyltransferase
LESAHTERTAEQVTHSVLRAVHGHHQRIEDGIVLYAGTNIMSPAVLAAHDAALSTRPALGWPGEKVQTAVDEIEDLEVLAATQVARAMRGSHAEVRYVTATMANLATYIAFAQPGDTIAALSPEAGGHASHQQILGTAGVRGLTVNHLPYSPSALDLDHALLVDFMRATRPRIVVVGGSVTLFPHDLGPVRAAADDVGAIVVYDASHTAGLIAAGLFQDPLSEGADVVTFSTYKTFGGPAGGAAVSRNPDHAEQLALAAYPTMLSNYDPARLGPLAVAAAEAVDQKPPWATATVEYAAELAGHLNSLGLVVIGRGRGYTRSHQLVIDASRLGGGPAAVRRLERNRIYTGACRLPWQSSHTAPEGIRLGAQEFIRRGAHFDTIPALAGLIHHAATATDDAPAHPAAATALRDTVTGDLWGRPHRRETTSAS